MTAGTFRLQFANEVLHMLRYISADPEVAVVFMLPELIDRMSQMLNHFLAALLGPKCATLKVDEPERYNFNAKKLLLEISITVVRRELLNDSLISAKKLLLEISILVVRRDHSWHSISGHHIAARWTYDGGHFPRR